MTAGLFVDHADLGSLNQSLAQDTQRHTAVMDKQFWSTPERPNSSPVQETLEIGLGSPNLLNWIEFDAARFPHDIELQYLDATGVWRPLLDAASAAPAVVHLLKSQPARFSKATAVPGHLHPQHAYLNHWEPISLVFRPVQAQGVRLVLTRTTAGTPPVDHYGNVTAYSLAIANLNLGYQVTSVADLPRIGLDPASITTASSFASTNDVMGSAVDYAVRTNRAELIKDNTQDDLSLVWKSEPQPYPDAVVNFYADLRDATGAAQIIDRIFIDPLYAGAHLSLYYSNDVPVGGFDQNNVVPLRWSDVTYSGAVFLGTDFLHTGAYGSSGYVALDNDDIGFDRTLPYWIGLTFKPLFAQGADALDHVLIDFTGTRIALTQNGVKYTVGMDVLEVPVGYGFGQELRIVAGYDGTSISLTVRVASQDESGSLALTSPVPTGTLPTITFGTAADGSLPGNVAFYDIVIKEEATIDYGFLDAPDQYSSVAQFPPQDAPQTRDALVRFDPGAASSLAKIDSTTTAEYAGEGISDPALPIVLTNYCGFFVTRPLKYESIVWTPIPRDFTMHRGWLKLPLVSAKFINFEITNLQAEYREVYMPTARRVKRFPAALVAEYQIRQQTTGTTADATVDTGLLTSQDMPTGQQYEDFPAYNGTGGTLTGFTATEAFVATDYRASESLALGRGAPWAYRHWHTPTSAPRWSQKGTHPYSIETISQTTKVAFFTGLRQVRFARQKMTAIQDAEQFNEPLLDGENLVESNWLADVPGSLSSGSGTHVQAVSTTLSTVRDVLALQFAANQSAAQQLLSDPDFADPAHRYWEFVGDAQQGTGGRFDQRVGTTLPVSRAAVLGHWEDIAPVYGTWGALASVTYGQLRAGDNHPQATGGVASATVAQPTGGQLYAAARVIAPKKLSSPLWVQIYDPVTDAVLSESSMEVNRDQVAEWYTSYGTGQGGQVTPNTWGDLTSSDDLERLPMFDAFHRADTTTAGLGKLDSGQTWTTPTTSLRILSNQARVNALGDSSYFDTGIIWGSLVVTLGNAVTAGTVGASVPMLDLGRWMLMNDGRVISTVFTDSSASRYTMAPNDVLRFDFVPTNQLVGAIKPSGADPILTPYALVIYRNGTFVVTLLAAQAPGTLKGLLGAATQTYANLNWTPSWAQVPEGEITPIMAMPDGSLSADGTQWTGLDGKAWTIYGSWTFTKGPTNFASIHIAQPTSVIAQAARDYGSVYGSLTFRMAQLATGIDPSTYAIAILDLQTAGNSLFLMANGSLAREDGTVVKAGVVPSVTAASISIRFVQTKYLSSAFKTTYSIGGSDTQALIFTQNGLVVGVASGTGLWSGSIRGIAGYNDQAGHYTLTEGFGWSPDASQVFPDVRNVTWGFVSVNNTITWDELASGVGVIPSVDPISVRVIQKAASFDIWELDNVSLFYDPIVWEFSNDDGFTWARALDIRNNPKGTLLFPPPVRTTSVNAPSNKLRWRVTSYGPNAWISNLVIRPWYLGQLRGTPVRPVNSRQGPNLNPRDHYMPITQDPHWQTWSSPVPQEWWFAYRDLDPTHLSDATTPWITLTVGDTVVLQ